MFIGGAYLARGGNKEDRYWLPYPWTTEIPIRVCWIDLAQYKPRQLSEKLPLSLPNYPKKVPTAGCG